MYKRDKGAAEKSVDAVRASARFAQCLSNVQEIYMLVSFAAFDGSGNTERAVGKRGEGY